MKNKITGILVTTLLIVSGFGSIFGVIETAEADFGDVVDSFNAPGTYPFGLAYDGTYLWNADLLYNKIYKLTTSGNVVDSFDTPPGYKVYGLTWDGNHLWCVGSHYILKLTTSGTVVDSFELPYNNPGPMGLTYDGVHLYCTDVHTDKIYKLTTSGTVVNSFDSPGDHPAGLTWVDGYFWHADAGQKIIYKLDHTDGAVVNSFDSPGDHPAGLTFDGVYLWHSNIMEAGEIGIIYKIDVGTQHTVTFYTDPSNKGSITFDGNTYSNGQSTSRMDGSYSISANPATNYVFDHWETSGGINVANSNQQSTTATINNDGNLKAYFIPGNQPPDPPHNPNPNNHATIQTINVDLSWSCDDPDDDPLLYDVYFGPNTNPPLVESDYPSTVYGPGELEWDTKYYWKIVAKDNHDHSTTGPLWDFTTSEEANYPPYEPSNPSPAFGASDIDINVDMSWTGGDPNPGDTVTYDVYFGTNQNNLDLVSRDQASTTYNPGTLEFEKTYYWKITAEDNHGATTEGPKWHFTTEEWDCNNLPDLYFPRATETKIVKQKLNVFIPFPWDLNEGEYPSHGYKATSSKFHKNVESKLYDEHCGYTDPITGVGAPETYRLETFVGHKYTFPSCGTGISWTPPCRVKICGDYGMDGLAGLLDTGWLGRADIDISLIIIHEGLPIWGEREFKVDHYGIGPIDDDWYNIKDSFSIQTSEDIYFQYGETYSFYLRVKATMFLTSQGIPFISWLDFLGPLPVEATGWARAEIGGKFNNIQLIWQNSMSSTFNGNGNLPPTIPDQGHGSEGIVNEEHGFFSNGSIDPNGDLIFYKWLWDDGTTSEWIGPYASGDPVTMSHTYTKPGVYNVKLEAKDIYDAWSGLSTDSFNLMKYPEGKIIVNSPNSNDEWRQGETYGITWNCNGYTGDLVEIFLYSGDGDGNYDYYSDITSGPVQNSGSYSWHIGFNIDEGDDYTILVYDLTNAANCSNVFSINKNQGPNKPDKPSGPTSSMVGTECTFSTSTTDPEGGQIKYGWDWTGNKVVDDWSKYYSSGETCEMTHSWDKKATYNVRVKAQDRNEAESSWSEPLSINILNTAPDKPSKPSGPSSGKAGTEYTYSTSTNDADAHRVKYCFDWDDGTTTWTDFYSSGATVSTAHKWSGKGDYSIRVKAQDEYGEESEWSDSLSVSMPKSKATSLNSLFLRFLERLIDSFPLLARLLQLFPVFNKIYL